MKKAVYILAVETSCDDTSIAIVQDGKKCIALSISSQIDTHKKYGGVVPEIASRMHSQNLLFVLEDVLDKSEMKIEDMDAIAVTYKPGLLGSLLVGIEFAKTLAMVYKKPLIGVNHLIGHIYANNLEDILKYPLLALVVSGGHTELSIMENDYEFNLIGNTLDDAIGESFDKIARVLGFPYPGGPNIEKAAEKGNDTYILPTPVDDETYNFSYSGLKSHVLNIVNNEKMKGNEIRINDLACSFQNKAVDEIIRKVEIAFKNTGIKRIALAGGVSANKYLQNELKVLCDKYKAKLYCPSMIYCTDNAAMIGAAAYPLFLKKDFKDFYLDAQADADLIN